MGGVDQGRDGGGSEAVDFGSRGLVLSISKNQSEKTYPAELSMKSTVRRDTFLSKTTHDELGRITKFESSEWHYNWEVDHRRAGDPSSETLSALMWS